MTAAVRLDRVDMTYRSEGRAIAALAGVSLSVEPGEFVSLIGPSGCGKSTILRIVADILKPSAGHVHVCGLPAEQARLDHRYSFVFQEPVLLPWRKIADNVGLPLELARVPADQRRARVSELLSMVQLDGFGERLPHELSGGMRMRASLARALTQNPPVLLMDEPFGALDEITRLQMNRELLRVWSETNAAVLFVTHSIDEAVLLSDRVVILSARPGRIAHIVDIDLPRPRDHSALVAEGDFRFSRKRCGERSMTLSSDIVTTVTETDTPQETTRPARWAAIGNALMPFAIGGGILLALEIGLWLGNVPSYILPRPSLVFMTIVGNADLLARHAWVTIVEAALGFIVGNLIGILLAVVFLYSRHLERGLFPIAQTIRSIPVVALAPLFLFWFGNGLTPKVITAALICFFPTLVNSFRGLTSVDRLNLELFHTLAASPAQVFWKVRWPAALPSIFAALKIASASAIIGALIAEWIGSDKGLGYLVVTSTYEYRVELLWATITVTSVIAIIAFELIVLWERYAIPWQDRAKVGE